MKKKCLWCSQDKSLEAFGFDRRSTDGRQARCRECVNKASRKYRQEHREEVQARAMVRYIEKYCRTPKPAQLPLLAER